MKIQRLVFANDERVDTVLRDKILAIPVKPGLATGTEIVFAEEGDQGPSRIPGNVARKLSLGAPDKHSNDPAATSRTLFYQSLFAPSRRSSQLISYS